MAMKSMISIRAWNPQMITKATGKKLELNLDKAAQLLTNYIVQSFGSAPKQPLKSGKGFRKFTTLGWKESHPSAPGEIPHVVTGALRRSITWSRSIGNAYVRKIGSTLPPTPGSKYSYAFYLEFGTSRMAARPFMYPALRKCADRIARLIGVNK